MLIANTIQTPTLEAISISNNICDNELGRYSFIINAELNGNISKSMFDNYIFKAISYDYNENLKINCVFPPVNGSYENNYSIEIPCYIDNAGDANNLKIYLIGGNDQLQLKNFDEILSNINYINCKKYITLILGEIIDRKCEQFDDYSNYNYKYKILNETIPEELFSINIYFEHISKNYYYYYYESYCKLIKINGNNLLECNIQRDIKLDTIYYENNNYNNYNEYNKYYELIIKSNNVDIYRRKYYMLS